jgi:hypothetical protein
METLKELHSAIEYLEISSIQNEMHYAKLLALKYASVRELWLMLAPVESLADRVAAAGNLEAAESAYSRVLDAYGALDTESFHEVRGLRLKMADFYIKMDAPICAERLLWEALDLRESPARAHKSDLEVLKRLARSLPQTSHDLSTVFESSVVEPTSCNSSPFPPLHRMIGSEYASKVEGNIFQTGPVLERYWPQNSLVGGMEAVMEVLQEFSYSDLETRDIHGRSPLYLASLLQKEAIGCALMTRASECEGMARRMTNARDVSGQTVLGIGILNGCSLSFIKALIENGAELDPEPLMPSPLTPLQAASWLGLSETVDLLLDHGAEVDRVFPGNKTAEILALEGGHNEIAERISNIFSETSISHSLEIDFTCPLSPYIPYVTIQSDNIY